MIMIPLIYVLAMIAIFLVWQEFTAVTPQMRNMLLVAFLFLLAFQAVLIGTRFGYEVNWLKQVQPFSAALLPPLAYLAFRGRKLLLSDAVHLILPALTFISVFTATAVFDGLLAISNICYATLLAMHGRRGSDALDWAGTNRATGLLLLLWSIAGLLFFSGLTDALIAADFLLNAGKNIRSIVSMASLIGLGMALATALSFIWKRRAANLAGEFQKADPAVFHKVEELLADGKLFLDPDINLNRVARRLSIPSREVSRAINGIAGQNFSQYVNALRINEACELMKQSDASVTSVIYLAGFNTKSNFNREFLRVTGKSPSEWRNNLAS